MNLATLVRTVFPAMLLVPLVDPELQDPKVLKVNKAQLVPVELPDLLAQLVQLVLLDLKVNPDQLATLAQSDQ